VDLPADDGGDYLAYRRVMTAARDYVASWGGQIQALRMPSPYRRKVLQVAKDLGFTTTDLYSVFDRLPDPTALHPFGVAPHFTPDGNRVVAAAIAEDVRSLLH
jgi:hypothetical protein